jgi:excisionase family DNA binding protein
MAPKNLQAVAAEASEQAALTAMATLLLRTQVTKLVAANGVELMLPESVQRLIQQGVQSLAQGHAVSLMPLHQELSTNEAADLLGVSRPYLVRLLEQGAIPFAMTGTHRRVRLKDLISYKERRDAGRRRTLDQLTQMSEDLGLYPEDDGAS